MGRFIDIEGKPFGLLTAVRPDGKDKFGLTFWLCKCVCGKEKRIRVTSLIRPARPTRSCGCIQPGATATAVTTHGHTKGRSMTKEYKSWTGMRNRCHNPKDPHFKDYGARGISVCVEWLASFDTFISHVGRIPQDGTRYTLDRIDNERGYEPGNVRWADKMTQASNRRNSIIITAFGKTMTLPQWSRETGLCKKTIRNRLLAGWTHERAISEPLHHQGPKKRPATKPSKGEPFTWIC